MDFTLDRFKSVLKFIEYKENSVNTLVIGGTNGKGTTSLLLSSALCLAGHRVATYLSPHLQNPHERFLLNLIPIDDFELESLANDLKPLATRFRLTYFEFLTLVFLVWAERSKVDFVILEVGLGGRLDATNISRPLACAITNISLDHEEYLGNTLESILNEKLGILRPEGLLFTHINQPELLSRIQASCDAVDAVYYFSNQIKRKQIEISWQGQTVLLNGYPFNLTNPSPGSLENAALAFHLLRIVFPKISVPIIQQAFARIRTPGRMEVVSDKPRIILSGDHNPAGLDCLLTTLHSLSRGKLFTLCAFSPDKPYQKMFRDLQSFSTDIVLTELLRYRTQMPENYRGLTDNFLETASDALEQILNKCTDQDTILVTGSLYLVGELRGRWRESVRYLG